MRQCSWCGENNHDDARYCGVCGTAMPSPDGIESLVNGDVDADDGSVTSAGAVGAVGSGHQPSEFVDAPRFGEPGSATGPETPPGPPPTGPVPEYDAFPAAVPVTPVRSVRSASIMIAALAAAAVVIIGGVFILLSSGQGGTDVARTGDDRTAPSVPLSTLVQDPAPDTTIPIETAPAVTTPPVTVAPPTAPPATAAPVTEPPVSAVPAPSSPTSVVETPPSTAATTSAPTTPPTTAAPTTAAPTTSRATTAPPTTATETTAPSTAPARAPGDLGLTEPVLDEKCDGRYITFVGSAVGDRPYTSVVTNLLDRYPGTSYIWTKACPSLRQELSSGADIYGVVFGPFASQAEACAARSDGPEDAYVRRISTFDPPGHTIRC